jgi:hypothetical protein
MISTENPRREMLQKIEPEQKKKEKMTKDSNSLSHTHHHLRTTISTKTPLLLIP